MSGQQPYNPNQPNQAPVTFPLMALGGFQMYPSINPRMQQPFGSQPMGQVNYGQPAQYAQMLGQPGPQMTGLVSQPRSPMVQNLQTQGPTTGQPSPLAGGPHSHLGPGSIGAHGGPHSTGPLSVHGNPLSTGPASVLGPQSVPASLLSGGPHSLGPSMGNPPSVLNPQSTGGPGSVLGSGGPHSNLGQSGGPLSVHGGPASAGEFLGNPQSVQIQQPMSVPRNEDPRSVGPHSVNPTTPMNPSSAQMNQSHTPATPGQALKQEPIPEQSVLTATDPVSYGKDLILKDIRHCILKYNSCVADYIRDKRGEGNKSPAQTKEDFLRAADALLAAVDDCDNSMTVIIEAPKQADRLDKSASVLKDKLDTPMQASIMHKRKTEEMIRKMATDAAQIRAKLRSREGPRDRPEQEDQPMEY